MKLTIERDALLRGVRLAAAIAPSRTAPVSAWLATDGASAVRIVTTSSRLVRAANELVGVETTVPAEVVRGGVAAVSTRTSFEVLRDLPKGPVELEADGQHGVRVKSGRIHVQMDPVSLAQEPPDLPQPADPAGAVRIPIEALSRLIRRTITTITLDDTWSSTYRCDAAFFEGDGKILRMVTTDDGHLTCAEEVVDADDHSYQHAVLIPKRGLDLLQQILRESGGDLRTVFEPPYMFIDGLTACGVVRLAIGLANAAPPPYREVVPRGVEYRIEVERGTFATALRRVSCARRGGRAAARHAPSVYLHVEANKMRISSDNSDASSREEEIDVRYDGKPFDIIFNARYLLDILEVIISGSIQIDFGGLDRPAMLRGMDDEQFYGIVMPRRIQS